MHRLLAAQESPAHTASPPAHPPPLLQRLAQRYKVWKKSFKARLSATQQAVKSASKREASRLGSQGSGLLALGSGSSRHLAAASDSSLTSRLFGGHRRGGR